jgi:DEAD/DEAH box helicase domain-containing protein
VLVIDLIESIKRDKRFKLHIAAHKYIPPVEPRYGELTIVDKVRETLRRRGLGQFYSHQVEGINLVRRGNNVVVMTPTASGKSLVYNIPVLESIIENSQQKALYIFPLKGLEQDQVKNLNELHASMSHNSSSSEYLLEDL